MPTATAQQQPRKYGDIVIPFNGMLAFWTMTAGKSHGFVTGNPIHTDIGKTAENKAKQPAYTDHKHYSSPPLSIFFNR